MSAGDRGARPFTAFAAACLAAMLAFGAGPAAPRPRAKAEAAPPVDPRVIQSDPAVRRGVLPNGLRYAVMYNASETNVSMRLGFDVGSFDEGEDERGVAHLVEHLAFDAPDEGGQGIDKVFGAKGIAFGRDQNATTTVDETIYRLDMPTSDPETVALGFKWLRAVADGLKVSEASVVRERDVIQAERSARRVTGTATGEAVIAFQVPDVRSARPPIGDEADIARFSAAGARAFYNRLYRPEHAVIVVVGHLPADELERRVVETFKSWTANGAPPKRATAGAVNFSRPRAVFVRADESIPPAFSACRIRPPTPKIGDRVDTWREHIASQAWGEVLNRRFAALAASSKPPFLVANSMASDTWREASAGCVVAVPINGNWPPALDALHQELRRMAAAGPTKAEAESTLEEIRSRLRGGSLQASTRTSEAIASSLVGTELQREVFATPAEFYRAYNVATEGMTAADLKTAFLKDWSGSGPLLTAVGPEPPTAAQVEAIWTDGERTVLSEDKPGSEVEAAAADGPTWAYSNFGASGRIARSERVKSGDFSRVTFRNGVVLNIKESASQRRSVEVRVRFGAGRRELANADLFAAHLATGIFSGGGVKRHTYQEIDDIFRDDAWEADLGIGDDAFTLRATTTTSALDSQLEILAAYMTEPGFDANFDARIPTVVDAMYRVFRGSPSVVTAQAIGEAIQPGGPQNLPPKAALAGYRMKDFHRILSPALTQAPMEITIVGDIDTRYAIRQVARTFGALPPRPATPRARADTLFLTYPSVAPPTIRVTHEGPPERAIVAAIWPLYVATPERRREEVAAMVVTRVLADRLNDRVRRELHLAYSPSAQTSTPDKADQGYISAVVEAAPAAAETVLAEIRKEGLALARGEFDSEALERARKPFVAGLEAAMSANSFWAELLSGSAADPARVSDGLGMAQLAADITLDEAVITARTWLSAPPLTVIASPQPGQRPAAKPAAGAPGTPQ